MSRRCREDEKGRRGEVGTREGMHADNDEGTVDPFLAFPGEFYDHSGRGRLRNEKCREEEK